MGNPMDQKDIYRCGVCAHKCPTNSLVLQRREKTQDPPIDPRDYMQRFFSGKQASRG
jgi:ferredoxin